MSRYINFAKKLISEESYFKIISLILIISLMFFLFAFFVRDIQLNFKTDKIMGFSKYDNPITDTYTVVKKDLDIFGHFPSQKKDTLLNYLEKYDCRYQYSFKDYTGKLYLKSNKSVFFSFVSVTCLSIDLHTKIEHTLSIPLNDFHIKYKNSFLTNNEFSITYIKSTDRYLIPNDEIQNVSLDDFYKLIKEPEFYKIQLEFYDELMKKFKKQDLIQNTKKSWM